MQNELIIVYEYANRSTFQIVRFCRKKIIRFHKVYESLIEALAYAFVF